MTLEEMLSGLNQWHFFKEFVYSKNKFKPTPKEELELADSLIWVGNILVAFQAKERNADAANASCSPQAERMWFKKNVLGKATSQIRDTCRYLDENQAISLANNRGHSVEIKSNEIEQFHKLVVYRAAENIPLDCLNTKYHSSKTAGFIHVIPAHVYLEIVRTLLTPAEIIEYLAFRRAVIERWPDLVRSVPEQALVGQYLMSDGSATPDVAHAECLSVLEQNIDEWDMSGIIGRFSSRITIDGDSRNYYPIITEIALLKRYELKELKTRFKLAIEKAKSEQFELPYRIAIPRTDCGFVFVPISDPDMFRNRRTALLNFTQAHKYETRLTKCVGVAIGNCSADGDFQADWCYINAQWEYDAEIESALESNYPFRALKVYIPAPYVIESI